MKLLHPSYLCTKIPDKATSVEGGSKKGRAVLNNPAFNLTVDDVPRGDEDKDHFLWHIRVVPRLTTRAGFELGSGMSINSVLPEEAAQFLNEVPIVPF